MEETIRDDFDFNDFLSEESKQEVGIEDTNEPTDNVESTQDVETQDEPSTQIDSQVETNETIDEQQDSVEENIPGKPVRSEGEPEWKYDFRLELWEKKQALAKAESEEEKSAIKQDMNNLRVEMSRVANKENLDVEKSIIDPDNIQQIVNETIERREQMRVIDEAEETFLKRHPEMRDSKKYDEFLEFVGETYNLRNKTKTGIIAVLENAHEMLYPSVKKNYQADSLKKTTTNKSVDYSGSTTTKDVSNEQIKDKSLVDDIKNSSGNDFSWIL